VQFGHHRQLRSLGPFPRSNATGVHSNVGDHSTVQAVTDAVVAFARLGVAVVSIFRPGRSMETVAVAGSEDAKGQLLGQRTPRLRPADHVIPRLRGDRHRPRQPERVRQQSGPSIGARSVILSARQFRSTGVPRGSGVNEESSPLCAAGAAVLRGA